MTVFENPQSEGGMKDAAKTGIIAPNRRGPTSLTIRKKLQLLLLAVFLPAFVVSDRPYRKGMSREDAVEIINGMTARGKLDPEVVQSFVASVNKDDWDYIVDRDPSPCS